MPGYIKKKLIEYKHPPPKQRQDFTLAPAPCTFRKATQRPTEPNMSPILPAEDQKFIQQVVGSFLF